MNANYLQTLCVAMIAFVPLSEPGAQATGPHATRPPNIERIDGSTLSCPIVGATEEHLVLKCPEHVELSLDEIRFIDFASHGLQAASNGTVFYLAAGGHMRGNITGESDESVVAETSLATALKIPFAALAGVWFDVVATESEARRMFDEAMANRLAGKDVLVTRGSDGTAAVIRGSVTALGPEGGRVLIGKTERPFSLRRVSGIVFAKGLGDPTRRPAHVTLTDGIEFPGRLTGGDARVFRFQTPFGIELEMPIERVTRVRFDSDRVVYLSDLVAARSEATGLLHLPTPARFDRSASNGVLSIEGRTYDKGIGVHAKSLLAYDLQGAYATLAATIGIDDAVRPRGSVVFKVEGDGRTLFESEVVTGSDRARPFAVDLLGVNELVLIVDDATDMDLSDDADWADIRLIKPIRAQSASDGAPRSK